MSGVITWHKGMEPIGEAVVAIGVFDGVHIGHRSLVRAADLRARRLGVSSVAVTFDRDPDQVVTPDSAAPQLLTLEDKCRYLAEDGARLVLVVPFDTEMASTEPEEFLDEVLSDVMTVREVHVGRDFRFGRGAAGDIDTLYIWGAENDCEVVAHELVEVDHEPVTSTRIRDLIASGDVETARELLGREPRVTGEVVRGREQGRLIGFPTANVVPVPFAATPADGVYAGSVVTPDGRDHPAAISVGLPPTFPDAAQHLEAHLIGYDGDLYGASITIRFSKRLRDLERFGSLAELREAIEADVARAIQVSNTPQIPFAESDKDLIDDPMALAQAEAAAAASDPMSSWGSSDEEWVELVGPRRLSGMFGMAGTTAFLVTAPLEREGIPFAWDPYPPEEMPAFRPAYGALDRPFTLLVPASRLAEAEVLMRDLEARYATPAQERTATGSPSQPVAGDPTAQENESPLKPRYFVGLFFFLMFWLLLMWFGGDLGWY